MKQEAAPAAIWFPGWSTALDQVRLPPIRRQQYRSGIIQYLRYCKETRQRATVPSARVFMQAMDAKRFLGVSQRELWKAALNWFFSEGAKQNPPHLASPARGEEMGERPHRRDGRRAEAPPTLPAATITGIPTQAGSDLGKTDWERRLIQVLRSRHYQWRTEQTYRGWATRFADWLRSRGCRVEEAGADQVREFLTEMATRQRVSASTQKQALNALVFLLREALERDPGEFRDYTRARPVERLPVVLSRAFTGIRD